MSDTNRWAPDDDTDSGSELPSAASEVRESAIRRCLGRLDATPPHTALPAPPAPEAPQRTAPPITLSEATLRSPPAGIADQNGEDRGAAPVARNDGTPPATPPAPLPKVVSAPLFLKSTEPAPDLPAEAWARRPVLPFRPSSAPFPPARVVARTLQTPVAGREPGRTAPLGDEVSAMARAVLPFTGSTAGAAAVTFPALTVKQYVSLRADLAFRPELAGETLRRYGVRNEAARRALDAHWQERLAASAELRAEWDAAVATYMRHLRGTWG